MFYLALIQVRILQDSYFFHFPQSAPAYKGSVRFFFLASGLDASAIFEHFALDVRCLKSQKKDRRIKSKCLKQTRPFRLFIVSLHLYVFNCLFSPPPGRLEQAFLTPPHDRLAEFFSVPSGYPDVCRCSSPVQPSTDRPGSTLRVPDP